jgi:adenylate cyclase
MLKRRGLSAVIAGCIGAVIALLSPIEALEFAVLDLFFRVRGVRRPPAEFVIVGMDEESYRNLDVPLHAAWPRALHAQLLDALRALGAARVVYDILFLDPGSDPAVDADLARAIGSVPTVLGAEISVRQLSSGGGGVFTVEELLEPAPLFRKAAQQIGLVALPEERGRVRHFLTERTSQSGEHPSLAEAAIERDSGREREIPNTRDLLNFYGPGRTVPTLSYHEVLDLSEELRVPINGKTVFVGLSLRSSTGPAQQDLVVSPFPGARMFGVEVHATAAANLFEQSWIRRAPRWVESMIVGAFCASTVGFMIFLEPLLAIAIGSLLLASVVGASFAGFSYGWFFGVSGLVLMCWPVITVCLLGSRYLRLRQSERAFRSAFELYVSPAMAKTLEQNSAALNLGGEKLWVTAFFSDIVDFTAVSEEMPAERTSEMLNQYFSEIMEVIFQRDGTLLKFIGDAVFALWGAPIKVSNHAEQAILTALDAQRAIAKFNAQGRFPALHTRIGIHTGPMLVGNLGSKRRFDYTAIGDAVNLASRVEGMNKIFGTQILFTEASRRDSGAAIDAVPIGSVRVKGRRELVKLFTVFDSPPATTVLSTWKIALDHFGLREFQEAAELFRQIQSQESRLAAASTLYISACLRFQEQAPGSGWAGEIEG